LCDVAVFAKHHAVKKPSTRRHIVLGPVRRFLTAFQIKFERNIVQYL